MIIFLILPILRVWLHCHFYFHWWYLFEKKWKTRKETFPWVATFQQILITHLLQIMQVWLRFDFRPMGAHSQVFQQISTFSHLSTFQALHHRWGSQENTGVQQFRNPQTSLALLSSFSSSLSLILSLLSSLTHNIYIIYCIFSAEAFSMKILLWNEILGYRVYGLCQA